MEVMVVDNWVLAAPQAAVVARAAAVVRRARAVNAAAAVTAASQAAADTETEEAVGRAAAGTAQEAVPEA